MRLCLVEIRSLTSITSEIKRRKKKKDEEERKTIAVKYKPFGIAMPCGLKCHSYKGLRDAVHTIRYDTIRYDIFTTCGLKSWRDGELSLAHGNTHAESQPTYRSVFKLFKAEQSLCNREYHVGVSRKLVHRSETCIKHNRWSLTQAVERTTVTIRQRLSVRKYRIVWYCNSRKRLSLTLHIT